MKYIIFLMTFLFTMNLMGQRIETSFGKNRVQFHKDYDEWRQYESDHFTSYWYGRAKKIANTTVDIAEEEYEEIRQLMEYRLQDKIELLVFTDLTDLKQSNIGKDEIFTGSEGEVNVVDNKIFIHYNGNHKQLYHNIRSGIAEVFLNQMYIGNSIRDQITNKFVLGVPDWFSSGLISYIGERWNTSVDNKFRKIVGKLDIEKWDFNKLTTKDPTIIGHSFWYFIDQNYGRSTISNILYLTRIYKNNKEAFLYELGQELDVVLKDWKTFCINKLLNTNNTNHNWVQQNIDSKNYLFRSKKDESITKLKYRPDHLQLLYCRNFHGKYSVDVYDFSTGKDKCIFKLGYKNLLQETDYNYPLITWDNNESVSVIYEKRDVIYLRKINILTEEYIEQEIPRSIQRIYSISHKNEDAYIVSASMNGSAQIYEYNAKQRRFKVLTNGQHDNLEASYIKDGDRHGILFSSSRETNSDDIIKRDNWYFNIYYMDLSKKGNPVTIVAKIKDSNQSKPKYLGSNKVSFLSDITGFQQQYIVDLDTKEVGFIGIGNTSVINYDSDYKTQTNIVLLKNQKRNYIMLEKNNWHVKTPMISSFRNHEKEISKNETIEIEPIETYQFISRFKVPEEFELTKEPNIIEDKALKKHQFDIDRITGAGLAFRLDDYSFDYSSDILFDGLETYIEDQNNAKFMNNKGFLIKANTTDLFENYDIEAGIRIPTRLDGNEVYLVVQDNKRLLDKEYIIYRKSKKFSLDNNIGIQQTRKISYLGMYRLKYPFDVYRSLRLSGSYHVEEYGYIAVDDLHYQDPILNDKRIALKLEYIFDNTIDKDINILHGTRYKVYSEAINKFDLKIVDNPSFDINTGHTFVFGLDGRNYFPLGQHALIASRIAAFTSFGSEKILYQLGGVENWINPSFSNTNTTLSNQDFSYRYNVANLRGFRNNIRNGSSAALSSIELRLSPFRYFSKKRIRSSFFRNFQLNFFYDVGTAWYGLSPFNDNPLNKIHISQPPIFEIDITYHRDPIVMGYGIGVRALLLGTLVRIDYGWGIESGITQKPILYFAIGKDF